MRRFRLFYRIFPSYLLITAVALAGLGVFAYATLKREHLSRLTEQLRITVRLAAEQVEAAGTGAETAALCRRLGGLVDSRLTVIAPDGTVIGDSWHEPAAMDNHADRPEIIAALQGKDGYSLRYSPTARRTMLYVALPAREAGGVAAAVRAAVPLTAIDAALADFAKRIGAVALLIALLGAGTGWFVARRLSRPIEAVTQGAARFAAGDLAYRVPLPQSAEMAALADTLNRMAQRLDERTRAALRAREERDAVFASMAEGILAVDTDGRVAQANRAAAELLGVRPDGLKGKTIQEAVRNPEIQSLVEDVAARGERIERVVTLYGEEERVLQAHGSLLQETNGRPLGTLLVLNDVTRLRQLERARRDFVANVSHELKTPITSIKGFVETLLDGQARDAAETQRFLSIILRQVDRLNLMIGDILSLSTIEHETEQRRVERVEGRLIGVLKDAVEICAERARQKDVTLRIECSRELSARISAHLLEQALVNLIDNAVKFSREGGTVEIGAARGPDGVRVTVRDHGIGIERRHLARLFERFYRVDKGRDRKQGGTGLGLAIVKHVALAHGGRVDVSSTPGAGSLFTMTLPDAS